MSIKPLAMRDAFLERIWRRMAEDDKVYFVCADFGSPVLDKIRADFPTRLANVGIAEQNLINISSGLAIEGFKVFAYAIAPFLTMRCYEQIRVNLALLSEVRPMNVTLVGVGAGYSYVVSGPTHQCYEDLTLMRALPNMTVLSPADHIVAAALFDRCVDMPGLKYLRLDAQVLKPIYIDAVPDLSVGFQVLRRGTGPCLLATGYMTHTALEVTEALAANAIEPTVIDLFDITGYNEESLVAELSRHAALITLEEGFAGCGGLDAAMFQLVARRRLPIAMRNIGIEGGYRFELGPRQVLHEQVGIGPRAVVATIEKFLVDIEAEHMP
jgi:transketolase